MVETRFFAEARVGAKELVHPGQVAQPGPAASATYDVCTPSGPAELLRTVV